MEKIRDEFSIDINHSHALTLFGRSFNKLFKQYYTEQYSDVVILCIGTDRSTGDCLGPLVGHKLKLVPYRKIEIYGTLDNPVHAKNLCEVIQEIKRKHVRPFIIAIDACLGKPERVGMISIGKGPLRPGAGVNKSLPEIGHIHIVGVVNMSGFMEYLILQNTRLNLVMRMADIISSGIHFNIWKYVKDNNVEDQLDQKHGEQSNSSKCVELGNQ
ncbi:MAG: spore protease YyaC [Caldicoprobacterales bacterium]|nr:spore protease YyaC [Clostridiales bacterium]